MQTISPQTQPKTKTESIPSRHLIKIAYFIIIHHNEERFKNLFEKIYTSDQWYLIHIDRKAKPKFIEEIQQFLIHFPNVYILESTNINIHGFSIVEIEINAMKFLLNVSNQWDFFINLSGDDSPLKSQRIIRQFLSENREKNYLLYYDQKTHRPDTLKRIQNHFTELTYHISSFVYKREYMKDVIPYIGEKWFIFTRETCIFISEDSQVIKCKKFYLNTFLPGNSFFQTVLMNTTFHSIIVNDNKKVQWNTKKTVEIFINELKKENYLFIRKITNETDPIILEYIEESFHIKLPKINDVKKELRIGDHRKN